MAVTTGIVRVHRSTPLGWEACVIHYPSFIQPDAATQSYAMLKHMSDLQQRAVNTGIQPRLTAMTGDPSVNGYRYSGRILPSVPWQQATGNQYDDDCRELCHRMCERVNAMIAQRIHTTEVFNSCLLNYYRDGSDSIGEHSDDVRQLGHPLAVVARPSATGSPSYQWTVPPIPQSYDSVAIISLNAQPGAGGRKFFLRDRETRERIDIQLESGDLLLMLGQTQSHYTHGINKSNTVIAAPDGDTGRISASFRFMRPITGM